MLKRDELGREGSCLNKARDDELIFVLLDRDEAAPWAIRHWIKKRIELGLNQIGDSKIKEAASCAVRMLSGVVLWSEDDATCSDPLHETLDKAYQRLFGESWKDVEKDSIYDFGDCELILTDKAVVCSSYPGNDEIRARRVYGN